MNKYIKIGLSIAVVIGLGMAGVKAIKEAKSKEASVSVAKIYPIVVKTISPKKEQVRLTLPYLAEVRNEKDVQLSSRVSGRIKNIKKSGAHVKKGEVIARVDTTTIKSSLESVKEQVAATKTALKNLKQTHKRTMELLKIQGASIEESQKESTAIANLSAKLSSLKQQEIGLKNSLTYGVIRTPVDGVIAKVYGSRGAMSMPGKPIASISAKNGFYLLVRVPSALHIKGVTFAGERHNATALGSTFHGLAEYKVYIDKENLTSGDRVEVSVIVFDDTAILLPFDATLNRNAKSYVLVVHGDQAKAEAIEILQSAEEGVATDSDLSGKKLVVAKPDILLKLVTGHSLKVEE